MIAADSPPERKPAGGRWKSTRAESLLPLRCILPRVSSLTLLENPETGVFGAFLLFYPGWEEPERELSSKFKRANKQGIHN